MKRLLAAGSGPIYQICKAFRDGEEGPLHNPEFTILEWYRPGFDHHQLMDEIDSLMRQVLGISPGCRLTYQEAFRKYAEIDPFGAGLPELQKRVQNLGMTHNAATGLDRDACLDLMLSRQVQPALGRGSVFIYDFPESQAAQAAVREECPPVAERFELFVDGVEIANGYHELRDPQEQHRRHRRAREKRMAAGLPNVGADLSLQSALAHGLPPCAGVAVGFDRLVMLATGHKTLEAVLTFPTALA